ncbi:MAG: phosphate butyryltransferase, partial [Alistipes sp.]|nr:phosphate butyryltransferase [Alistipes sp.]
MITKLSEIVETARSKGRKRLAVAYGQDSHTIAAVYDAYCEGLVEATIYGDRATIEKVCEGLNIDPEVFTIVDEPSDTKCVALAVADVVAGNADVLMKGLVSTDKYMRGILNKDAGMFPPKGVLSHVAIMEMKDYHKLVVISDVAVIPLPDFKQKQKLIGYLAQTAGLLGVQVPKIACVAPSEQVLPTVISSTEGAVLAKMGDRGQLGKVIVDGPLSLDVALYKDVAEHKNVKGSSVAGDPDCLLFPNIESANV